MIASSAPEYLVVVSDLHMGMDSSYLDTKPRVREILDNAVARAKHVVYNGDIYEIQDNDPRITRQNIANAIDDLDRQLKEKPDRFIHFIPGNHEIVNEFFHNLEGLQKKYLNFEWHPESIKIGDALFTHGDLQKDGKTGPQRGTISPERARKAPTEEFNSEDMPRRRYPSFRGRSIRPTPRERNIAKWSRVKKQENAENVYNQTEDWVKKASSGSASERETFHFSENRRDATLDSEAWSQINHIFSGHTHIPFTHISPNGDTRKLMHNSGSTVRHKIKNHEKIGFIAAELVHGRVVDVRSHSQYNARSGSAETLEKSFADAEAKYGHVYRLLAEGMVPEQTNAVGTRLK